MTPERKGKPQVGQELFAVVGKQRSATETFNVVVERVGQKYFYCHQEGKEDSWRKYKIRIDSWTEATSWQAASIYREKQDYDNEQERLALLHTIKNDFYSWSSGTKDRLSLDDLRAINAIIEPKRTKAV